MNNFGFIQTGRGVTLFFGGKPVPVDASHYFYKDIIDELKKGPAADVAKLLELSDIPEAIKGKCFGNVTVTADKIYYKNKAVHSVLTQKMLDMMSEGWDISSWANFMDNVMANPSEVARNELYLFLEKAQMPITLDGHFLAFKKVRNDYTSIHDGKTDNSIGSKPSMPREEVDADRDRTCSRGLHFCAHDYLAHFGNSTDSRVVILKINPADVVAIPSDYKNAKGRAWTYEVVDEIANPGTGARSKQFDKAVDDRWDAPEQISAADSDLEKIGEALADTRPTVSHDEAMIRIRSNLPSVEEPVFGDMYTADEVLSEVRRCGSIRAAGRHLGIAKSTFGDWVKKAQSIVDARQPQVSSDMFVKIAAILVELLGVDVSQVQPSSKLITDIGADSLDVVEIVMTIEEEFGIEISDETLESFTDCTVSQIADYVERATRNISN